MADQVGAIMVPRNAAELRDQYLRDIRLAAIDSGVTTVPPVTPGSDWWMQATAVANIALIGLANIAISDSDSSIFTASLPQLERLRVELGLPDVEKSGASGKVKITVAGATTITSGTQLLLPNGFRIAVVGTYINPTDQQEIDVAAVDIGSASNAPGGTEVRFVSAPFNVGEVAVVSSGSPLVGGLDTETEDRLRRRILNVTQNRPAGGNWAHMREVALNASGGVQDAYVYPSLGGPSSVKVVPVRLFDRAQRDYSRVMSIAGLEVVRGKLQSTFSLDIEDIAQAVANQPVDVALNLSLPDSSLAGGNGKGWIDPVPWPAPTGGDNGRCQVTTYSGLALTTSAATTVAPTALQTHIAWWSTADMKFYRALVVSYTGSSGAWVLTLDRPLADSTGAPPTTGDYICPDALNLTAYGNFWLDTLEQLGPGENTADAARLPRSLRHPLISADAPSDINAATLSGFTDKFDELNSVAIGYASATTPTIPATVKVAPSVLTPRKFAIYKA